MRKAKLERINSDIEILKKRIAEGKARLAELQKRLRLLETERNDLRDAETLALVRSERISDAELNELIRSIRNSGKDKAPAPTKLSEQNKTTQEETRNANEE